MKQWVVASWLMVMMVVSTTVVVADPKTRTDLLLPREGLGPEVLVEVVVWARELVAAGKRGDAEAARELLEATPTAVAPIILPDDVSVTLEPTPEPPPSVPPTTDSGEASEVLPVADDDSTVVIPPVGTDTLLTEPVIPTPPIEEIPAGALVAVMSWCDEMLTAARAGDSAACEELVGRAPIALPAVANARDGGKSAGMGTLAVSFIGIGCAVVGFIIGAIVAAKLRR